MAPPFVLHNSLSEAQAALAAAPLSPRTAVLLPGPAADLSSLLTVLQAGRFSRIDVYTRNHASLFAQLVGLLPHPPVQAFANLAAQLSQLSQPSQPNQHNTVHIINLGDAEAYDACRATLQAGAALPVVLLRSAPPRAGAEEHKIGMAVASDGLARALVQQAPGRYRLHWLPPAAPESDRGRLYLYPFPTVVGQGMDESDYAALPALMRAGNIDAWCNFGPALQHGVAARALWSAKALPVVGMGHSLHAARLCTEMVMMLLSGPTLACDALIAPTRAGQRALEHALTAVSQWLGERMPQPPRFAGQLPIIPYGIDVPAYATGDAAAHRQALGWAPATGPCLLFLGRLDKQEKTDLLPLLLAVRALLPTHPQLHAVLAGADRGYAASLRGMAQTLGLGAHVQVQEDVSLANKIHLLGAADICVALSDNVQETYGLTVLEAMAAGRAVVAADWNGYRELVLQPQTGLLIPTHTGPVELDALHTQRLAEGPWGYGHHDLHESVAIDLGALIAGLDGLLSNPILCRNMGQAGQARARQDHDLTHQARLLGDFLVQAVAQARATPWTPPALRPLVDDLNARFAHYPSRGVLPDSAALHPGPSAQDPLIRGLVTQCLGLASSQELRLHNALLDSVQKTPGICMGDLVARLGNPPALRLRVLRCLKVGLLQT